ncbi:hypothetical protein LWI28_000062 [Acer negundo]|uniref:RING-type E3 ubiquitin transferase n=1 Tax=Acer negundo TaxID=4023 RepID=A0AAD5NP87_ACENE|nr:hypothetical protein LWI28_000062 [Acer negundo]
MEILISLALLFVGIAALVVIHVCIVGRAFRGSYDNGRFVQGIRGGGGVGGGGGNKTMSNEDLKKLPCFEYRVSEAETSSPVDCVICLEIFVVGDKCRSLPNCRHSFHAHCIDSWLLKTPICPICRTSACNLKTGEADVGIEMT